MTQYGMCIDLRRCAGCGACVVACQMQNNQRPGVSWNKLDSREWGAEMGSSGRAYVPHACMQCKNPACVAACPTGASKKCDDGITIIDYEKCIACGLCISACPYNARVLNNNDENFFNAAFPAPYEAYGVQRSHVVEKCIFCQSRVVEGLLPACTINCPGRARYFGDMDDPESPIAKFLSANEAVRIDETSFYYVPVTNMPKDALPFESSAETVKAKPGIDPVVLGVGAVAVAAAGVGTAVVIKKKKDSKEKGQENDR